jgi:hypothetical protein
MTGQGAACNWPDAPNDSVQSLPDTPALPQLFGRPACRRNGSSGSSGSLLWGDPQDPGSQPLS